MNSGSLHILLFYIFLLSFHVIKISAQNNYDEIEIEETLTTLDDEYSQENSALELAENLESLQQDPINLNTAKRADLEKLFFLNDFQIQSILEYRSKYGAFLSIYELTYVFGFDKAEVKRLMPYVFLEGVYYPKSYKKMRHLAINKIEFKNNQEKPSTYLPIKIYSRYAGEYDKIKMGFTAENDAYEPFFKKDNKYGFDYLSAYLQISPKTKWLEKIIIGDFKASFGQGLTFWGGYSMNKSVSDNAVRKRSQGFKPHSSSSEFMSFRGGAASINALGFNVNLFISFKKQDATLKNDTGFFYFTSIQESGLHRTENEMASENAIDEKVLGININKEIKWLKTGISYHYTEFSQPFLGNDRYDTQFLPTGKKYEAFSSDISVFLNKTTLFGEWAICGNKSTAWLAGLESHLPYNSTISVLYRDYDRGFLSLHGSAFGENSENRNEQGLYLGLENKTIPHLKINIYNDAFQFPWLTFYTDAPSSGNEKALFMEYDGFENIVISGKYKFKTKDKSMVANDEDKTSSLLSYEKKSFRIQLRYWLAENLQLTNRIETNNYGLQNQIEYGYLFFQDIKYDFAKMPITVYARATMFQTESFNTRMYQYENDLRYSFYVPFLNGKGMKYYAMVKYGLKDFLDIYVKTELIDYDDKEDEWMLKGQFVWKF